MEAQRVQQRVVLRELHSESVAAPRAGHPQAAPADHGTSHFLSLLAILLTPVQDRFKLDVVSCGRNYNLIRKVLLSAYGTVSVFVTVSMNATASLSLSFPPPARAFRLISRTGDRSRLLRTRSTARPAGGLQDSSRGADGVYPPFVGTFPEEPGVGHLPRPCPHQQGVHERYMCCMHGHELCLQFLPCGRIQR